MTESSGRNLDFWPVVREDEIINPNIDLRAMRNAACTRGAPVSKSSESVAGEFRSEVLFEPGETAADDGERSAPGTDGIPANPSDFIHKALTTRE